MARIIVALLICSMVSLPAHAGMIGIPDPIDQSAGENRRLNQEMNKDQDRSPDSAVRAHGGSSWWKWALALAILGGAAAAAGGHGGGGASGSSNGGGTTSVTTSW